MSFTLTSSGAAILKAGLGVSTAISMSGAKMNTLSDQVEGDIIVKTKRNWVTAYATLPDSVKNMLDNVASSGIAKAMINYDMENYGGSNVATTTLDVNDDIYGKGISALKNFILGDIKDP